MEQRDTEKQLKYRQLGLRAVYLAACALHDQCPQGDWQQDLESLYRFCKFHSITAIAAMALEKVWRTAPADDNAMKQWRQARDKAIRKNVLLNAERQRIMDWMESIGCWYMPLKGSLLQFDYPQFGMRQMSDNDILCDSTKSEEIYSFMLENGYSCELHNQGNHDEFVRQPVYNFEIHRTLFKPETAPELAAYYADIHQRSRKDPNNGFGYHLRDEDFYIYLTAHAYRHFVVSGIGIRNLMDVYIYLEKHGAGLDWDYIQGELTQLGAWDFECWCRRMSKALFGEPNLAPELSDADLAVLDAFFASGTFGTEEQLLRKAMEANSGKKGNKAGYFLRRVFPSGEMLGVMYPIVRGRPWLVPFVWVYRLVISVFKRPARVLRELKSFFRKYK